jgi:tetratricopeptide (TPR) repeat protein
MYGYAQGQTPALSRFANEALLFESAWSSSPQTLPAHSTIFSGQQPFAHGVRDNIGFAVGAGVPWLPDVLSQSGRATAGFVSTFVLRRQVGFGRGFAVFDDQLPAATPDRPLGEMQRPGPDTLAAALRWLGTAPSNYFLFFHIYEPHTPYSPPVVPTSGDRYDGEVTHADAIVGQLLDALRARGDYDRATIVVLSDHGEGLGDHGEDEHGLFLYRTTIRVPLLIKTPSSRRAGQRETTPVQHADIAPTLLALAGLPAPNGMTGRSLLPLLEGTGTIAPASIYAEAMSPRYHFGWSELYALTDERYRYIKAPRAELFDLTEDPREEASVIGARGSVASAMASALDALVTASPVSTPDAVSAADRQRLAALGYVGTQTRTTEATSTLADPKDKIDVLRRYQRASSLAGEGRWREAVDAYRALLTIEPDMIDARLQLAGAFEKSGDLTNALATYRTVIEQDSRSAAALTGAAALLVQLGRFDEARAHAELAVAVAPAQAHELLARLAVQRGDADDARRHARDAAAADATLPMPAFIEGLLLYSQNAFAAAVGPLTEAARALSARTEQVADVRYLLADALARQNRFADAEPWFVEEIAATPHHLRARAGLAMVRWELRRQDDARRTVADLEATAGRLNQPDGFLLAAQLWSMFGDEARAQAAAARGRAARPPTR